ncbi:4-carboxymuconolactone decarboxylase [Vibrio tubiashii]|nr:4-carboxymuconolactone decarboxylase [Vibrio tubiashii]
MSKLFFIGALFTIVSTSQLHASEEGFNMKEQAIIPIAAFAANGDIPNLQKSLNEGLDSGLTINQIKEVLSQVYAYAGFPRSLNALAAFMQVVEERKEKGLKDEVGASSSALPTDRTSLSFGTDNQTKLIGVEVKGPLFDFAPQIDEYLKAHLFGNIFERDLLSWREREIATISMLATIPGVNSQLASHYNISMNNEVTESELQQFISILNTHCGEQIANNAQQVLDSVLNK